MADVVRSEIGAIASRHDMAAWGVADAGGFDEVRGEMLARAASGRHAGMKFTYTDPEVATDVRSTFPWAESLIVMGHAYVPQPVVTDPGAGRIARFATADHYEPLREALGAVAHVLRAGGHRAQVLVDDNRLVDRAAAVRAGVGWWGKNTMVLAPGVGPWMLLGTVATSAMIDRDAPMRRDCGTCSACLPACPTGALVAPGVLDARLCLAWWLQAPGVIPRELRAAVGNRVYGCDDCLEACPPGSRLLGEQVGVGPGVDLIRLLATSDRTLLAEHGHFYIPGRRARYLRRNAIVALGNVGEAGSEAVLAGYLGHPDWLLRLHAAWALGTRSSAVAGAALRHAASREGDERVRAELSWALQQAESRGGPAGTLRR